MSVTPVIVVDRLNLTDGDFHAVEDLTFQVRPHRRPTSGTMHDLAWVAIAATPATRLFQREPRR
ncbi:hypothetical protein [Micromonospora sp. WMMD964]|uniref:hypothetical protein n=1 Tax=Micromonospora sp. WMMD964 TaxID=3016091 RepID=UPI00249B5718|nr:hypothetical protein [Micromonospora sp. WMMD964]WFF00242.1 hypothetical protein O7616_25615 [Micromonospora sp. WMMD964]